MDNIWDIFKENLDRGEIVVLDREGVHSMIYNDAAYYKGQIVPQPIAFQYKWGFVEYPLEEEREEQEIAQILADALRNAQGE